MYQLRFSGADGWRKACDRQPLLVGSKGDASEEAGDPIDGILQIWRCARVASHCSRHIRDEPSLRVPSGARSFDTWLCSSQCICLQTKYFRRSVSPGLGLVSWRGWGSHQRDITDLKLRDLSARDCVLVDESVRKLIFSIFCASRIRSFCAW